MTKVDRATNSFDLIIPVFNEAEGLPDLFFRLKKLPLTFNIIFIDNGSRDNSVNLIQQHYPAATLIQHTKNEGYGASLIHGMQAGNNDNIIIIDADCEYPPEALPDLLTKLEDSDVIYTSRFLNPSYAEQANMPLLKRWGNNIITGLFNICFSQHLTDLYTGCKAYKRHCIQAMDFQQTGFEHVLELSAKLVAHGYVIDELAVQFRARQTGTSKMNHIRETIKYSLFLVYYALLNRTGKLR